MSGNKKVMHPSLVGSPFFQFKVSTASSFAVHHLNFPSLLTLYPLDQNVRLDKKVVSVIVDG
jgi:hypothetical protein